MTPIMDERQEFERALADYGVAASTNDWYAPKARAAVLALYDRAALAAPQEDMVLDVEATARAGAARWKNVPPAAPQALAALRELVDEMAPHKIISAEWQIEQWRARLDRIHAAWAEARRVVAATPQRAGGG